MHESKSNTYFSKNSVNGKMKGTSDDFFNKIEIVEIAKTVLSRFREDECLRIAASLSYTTALSLVPLLAISFAIFAAFPTFEGVQQQLQNYVFDNFVPSAGEVVGNYLNSFTEKTGGMTAVGIVGLGLTAIMLLATIESALNRIFHVQAIRSVASRLLMFWALLTMGPLMIGASLSLSTYLFALTVWFDAVPITGFGASIGSWILPNIIMMAALTFMYIFVPNRSVSWINGLIGAFVAVVLFATLKKLFGLFISNFPSYETIYGVLATIPIFMIWMFLTWAVVLLGAILTAALEDKESGFFRMDSFVTPARLMSASLHVLRILREQQHKGGAVHETELNQEIGRSAFSEAIKVLSKAEYVAVTEEGKWILARDLKELDLADLHRVLGLDLVEINSSGEELQAIIQAEEARSKAMKISMAEVLSTRI